MPYGALGGKNEVRLVRKGLASFVRALYDKRTESVNRQACGFRNFETCRLPVKVLRSQAAWGVDPHAAGVEL